MNILDDENSAIKLIDGKIVPPDALELIVSDHCNISCRQCNHASPVMRKWNLTPERTLEDLSVLSKFYHAPRLKLIGGEPLLNPDLLEIARAARASGIAEHIYVVTNGILMNRMSADLWRELDAIEVSLYKTRRPPEGVLADARKMALRYGTTLNECRYDSFRYTFTSQEIADGGLVQDLFDACRIAQVWHCHAVYKGRFFRCPQSVYAPQIAASEFDDGIDLEDSQSFRRQLIDLVGRKEALASCRHCVGTCGKKQPHTLLDRRHWSRDLDRPIEEICDRELLQSALVENMNRDDCRIELERKMTLREYAEKKIHKIGRKLSRQNNSSSANRL